MDYSFQRPNHLDVSPDETKIAIYDSRNQRVLIADSEFRYQKEFSHPFFSEVWGFNFISQNEIVISNLRVGKVVFSEDERKENAIAELLFFDLNGNLVHRLEWKGEKGPIISPGRILGMKDGTLLVSDSNLNKYFRINRAGEVLSEFGEFGDEPGKFYCPQDIFYSYDGDLIAVDCYNSRLQLLNPEGLPIKIIADRGFEEGQVRFPESACLDKNGNLYVAEYGTMRISVFNRNFSFKRILSPKFKNSQGEKDIFGILKIRYQNSLERVLAVDNINSCIHVFDKDGNWVKAVQELSPK